MIPVALKTRSIAIMAIVACLAFAAPGAGILLAQRPGGAVLSGKIYNSYTKGPVDFAVVAVEEARVKARTGGDGAYSLSLPGPGTYTVIVSSSGLRTISVRMAVNGPTTRDFVLSPAQVRGAALTITGERDIQKIARYTMTVREMKEVPASFGDSISALTALPGVIRTSGFFGPLVIRGMDPTNNRYYIDDIPVYNPQHFGGIHSVISNDLMSEIDLYASAFPAQFGSGTGAVININTVDDVKDFGGVTEIGLISSNFLLKGPIAPSVIEGDEGERRTSRGYWIAAGRIGYLSLFVPTIYKLMTGDTLTSVPEYWDYQFKGKYFLNSRHALTALVMGSKDYINFINESTPPDEVDPLLANFQFKNDLISHSVGVYYTWQPNKRVKNTLLSYGSLNDSINYINVDDDRVAAAVKNINIVSKPYMYGLKEKFDIEWWKGVAKLRGAAELVLYRFMTDGNTFALTRTVDVYPDLTDDTLFRRVELGRTILNRTLSGYLENKFTFGKLTFVPGVRADYLDRSGDTTVDPRGMLSYEFPTDTTVSVAAGRYSMFIQTNPFLFNYTPNIAAQEIYKPERAIHRAAGVEQRIGLFTLKIEGFYNTFRDLFENDPVFDGTILVYEGRNVGRQKAYGAEVMLRLDREEGRGGPFGWVNYTYTQSKRKSGVSDAADGDYNDRDRYITYGLEQEHALKVVAGYTRGRHTLSSRFTLHTSFPYTPIVAGELSPDPTPPGYVPRYYPIYGTSRNSRHFPPDQRLDVRYSYKITHEWGYVSWYIEVINVYNYRPVTEETWNYRRDYDPDSNPRNKKEEGLSMIPNFGVEVKF